MVDCVRVGFVDWDDVFDVFGDIVDSTSEDHQLSLESTFLVVFQMKDVLGDALPIKIIIRALSQVDAKIDIFGIEDVFYPELNLQLQKDVFLKIELDVILQHYLDIEGKLYAKVCIFCCSYGNRFRVDDSDVVLLVTP